MADPVQLTNMTMIEAYRAYKDDPNAMAPTNMEEVSLDIYMKADVVQAFERRIQGNPALRIEWQQARTAIEALRSEAAQVRGGDRDPMTFSLMELANASEETRGDIRLALGVLQMFHQSQQVENPSPIMSP